MTQYAEYYITRLIRGMLFSYLIGNVNGRALKLLTGSWTITVKLYSQLPPPNK